jgi:hypothetical protein
VDTDSESSSPESGAPAESGAGNVESAETVLKWRRPASSTKALGAQSMDSPGSVGNGMSGRNAQQKHGTTRGLPRRLRTAKASRITGSAGKSRRACEWGGWGRLSVDGPGQNNPDRSEGPWGRATALMAVPYRADGLDSDRDAFSGHGRHEGRTQTRRRGHEAPQGKAPSDMPTLEPYWGKPAVRNLRGDAGNVGIIRSPLRACVPPDW